MPSSYFINGKSLEDFYILAPKTQAQWASLNPIIPLGEIVYEVGTHRQKIGNGFSPWLELPYENTVTPKPSVFSPSENKNIGDKIEAHSKSSTPHVVYDEGPSLVLLYENAKV